MAAGIGLGGLETIVGCVDGVCGSMEFATGQESRIGGVQAGFGSFERQTFEAREVADTGNTAVRVVCAASDGRFLVRH